MKATAAPRVIKLTRAQREALALVGEGAVSYRPGRTTGPHSAWTRYSYEALVGGRFVKRTKSVEALAEAGLVEISGSARSSCRVLLTEAGAALLGVEGTPVAALAVARGMRVFTPTGVAALVSDIAVEHGKTALRLRLPGGYYCTQYHAPTEAVLVAPVKV